MSPVTESTVSITKMPAFGVGEFSLVLDDAIRTANVYSTTDLVYGVLKLEDFKKIVNDCPAIGGKAVLHGFDLTYSLVGGVLDKQFNRGVLDNYRFLAKGFYAFFDLKN